MPIWLLDGSLLLFGTSLLDPATGARTELPVARGTLLAPGTDRAVVALEGGASPQVQVLQDGKVRWSAALPAPLADDTRTVVALAGDEVVVHTTSVTTGESTCWRVSEKGGAQRPPRCLEASFVVLDLLLPAGPDTWAVASHAEGVPAVDLVRWAGEATEVVPVPWRDLYPMGELFLSPRADGAFDVLTTCALGPEQPCLASVTDEGADDTVRRYRWTPGSTPVLLAEDAAPPRAPDPSSDRVAWIRGDKVCVDGPDQRRRCFPVE